MADVFVVDADYVKKLTRRQEKIQDELEVIAYKLRIANQIISNEKLGIKPGSNIIYFPLPRFTDATICYYGNILSIQVPDIQRKLTKKDLRYEIEEDIQYRIRYTDKNHNILDRTVRRWQISLLNYHE